MKLIRSNFEILEQSPGLEGIYEAIERAGRVCYKSQRPEGKTAKDFIDMLIKRGHLSPLEHGTVYLTVPYYKIMEYVDTQNPLDRDILTNPWTRYVVDYGNDIVYISTNYRHIIENNLESWVEYLCEPTEYHEKRVGVRVNCSIGISREWNRHRTLSVCEQSTRYCNYSKDKFNNELTFVIPEWVINIKPGEYNRFAEPIGGVAENAWFYAMRDTEERYLNMTISLKPQEAREVLPLSTATEVIYTGYISDWSHFFDMRCDKAAHPDIQAIAIPLKEEFIKKDYLK